jgi:hypothetical protein
MGYGRHCHTIAQMCFLLKGDAMYISVLILIPGDTAEEDHISTANQLIELFMQDDSPVKVNFYIEAHEAAEPGERYRWHVSKLPKSLEKLEIESVITPDGNWYDSADTPTGIWDDPVWIGRVRKLLKRYPDAIALRYRVHV